MRYDIYHLPGPIWWRILDATAPVIPGSDFGRYVVINPRAYHQFDSHLSDRSLGSAFAHGDATLLETRSIVLASESAEAGTTGDALAAFTEAEQLLRRLRFVSRQATVPNGTIARVGPVRLEQELAVGPTLGVMPGAQVRRHLAEWAITEEHVREAAPTIASAVPTHHELLLDSASAGLRGDDRSAILFAAIACEILAGASADAAQAARPAGLADPVFTHLRERARFAQLINVVSLYCRGVSLLKDDQGLYQRALKLYRTRNRIAHEGLPPLDETYLAVDRDGASEAIDIAIAVFSWYGEGARYVNPLSNRFLKLS